MSHRYSDNDGVRYCDACGIAEVVAVGSVCPDPRVRVEAVEVYHAEYLKCWPAGGDEQDHRDAVCQAVEAVVMHVEARMREALLSDKAVKAAWDDDGHGTECSIDDCGGCGGTHAECYHRSKIKAAVDAVTGEQATTQHCPECLRLTEDLERQKALTIQWARESARLHALAYPPVVPAAAPYEDHA